jgi:ribosomal protein S18 acetylase RimI-like enzyme
MRIERVTEATPDLVATIERLLPQLSEARTPPTLEELQQTLDGETMLLAYGEDGEVLGTLTLVSYRVASGPKARIEDVIVDEAARGQGIGEALVREALRYANELGVRTVELTSMPYREAANRLYRRLGFVRKPTNVYVWWTR